MSIIRNSLLLSKSLFGFGCTEMVVNHFRLRMARARGPFIRMWKAPYQLGNGYFFLYPDRVILQTYSRQEGAKFQRVPEEGTAERVYHSSGWYLFGR